MKHLAQWLAPGKHSIHVTDLSINFISIIFCGSASDTLAEEVWGSRQQLPIQVTEKTYVLFTGSCQTASVCL